MEYKSAKINGGACDDTHTYRQRGRQLNLQEMCKDKRNNRRRLAKPRESSSEVEVRLGVYGAATDDDDDDRWIAEQSC